MLRLSQEIFAVTWHSSPFIGPEPATVMDGETDLCHYTPLITSRSRKDRRLSWRSARNDLGRGSDPLPFDRKTCSTTRTVSDAWDVMWTSLL